MLGVFLPYSNYLISVSQFFLLTNWVLELDFRNKWERLKNNYPALSLIGLYFIHLIWMINVQDVDYGLKELRVKLPLLALPLIIGSSKRLRFKELKFVLLFFLASLVSSTGVSSLVYFGFTNHTVTDYRDISIFISHIRLSLLCVMGIFIAFYYATKNTSYFRFIYAFVILWLLFFLYILNSYSGMLILLLTTVFVLLRYAYQSQKKKYRFLSMAFLILVLGSTVWQGFSIYKHFFKFDAVPALSELEPLTVNNNPYIHNTQLFQVENGHRVYLYICEEELEKEWNKCSALDYREGKNAKGEFVRFTLWHYLTSLNYRKDSVGVNRLTDEDIRMIEQGNANYIFKNKYSLYAKIYPLIKQLYEYKVVGYMRGGTLVQRIEYLRVAYSIVKEHFFWGTGTANVQMVFDKKYESGISNLPEDLRFRAHNQFITFFISFGFWGFLLSLFLMISPFFRKNVLHFLSAVFFVVGFASMLNEDTLETQVGVTFFVFFYSLLLVAYKREDTY